MNNNGEYSAEFKEFLNDRRFEKAVAELTKQYKKAKNMTMVHNPIAYALYYTWREFDEKVPRKEMWEV